jgi:integrase
VEVRGRIKAYPKTRKSNRTVPVPAAVLEAMSELMRGRGHSELVFGSLHEANFRLRIWYPAIERAGVRRFPPRVMRHTAASWLMQDGVPLYEVQALLGHESFATTQRYAHLAPDAHRKVLESWQRRAAAAGGTQ